MNPLRDSYNWLPHLQWACASHWKTMMMQKCNYNFSFKLILKCFQSLEQLPTIHSLQTSIACLYSFTYECYFWCIYKIHLMLKLLSEKCVLFYRVIFIRYFMSGTFLCLHKHKRLMNNLMRNTRQYKNNKHIKTKCTRMSLYHSVLTAWSPYMLQSAQTIFVLLYSL